MYYLLAFLPLIVINLWHAFILIRLSGQNRPNTLSEHACMSPVLLIIHKIVHSFASIVLLTFAISYLWPKQSLSIPAVALSAGAIFDAVEVLTLNKENSHEPLVAGPHQITAWAMSLSYLTYGILITRATELPVIMINAVWIFFVIILCISAFNKFRKFWIAQMSYFSMLSLFIAIAHLKIVL